MFLTGETGHEYFSQDYHNIPLLKERNLIYFVTLWLFPTIKKVFFICRKITYQKK